MNTYESLGSSLCLSESWNDHIMNYMHTLKIHELHASCPNIQSWEKSLDIYHGRQLTERTFNEVPILSNQFFPKIDVKKMGTERLMDWNIVWFEYNYSWANLSNPFSVGLCSSLLYSTPLTVLPHHRRAEEAVWVWEGETAASWTPPHSLSPQLYCCGCLSPFHPFSVSWFVSMFKETDLMLIDGFLDYRRVGGIWWFVGWVLLILVLELDREQLRVWLLGGVMGERIPPGSYFQYPPSGLHASPHRSSSVPSDRERSVSSTRNHGNLFDGIASRCELNGHNGFLFIPVAIVSVAQALLSLVLVSGSSSH